MINTFKDLPNDKKAKETNQQAIETDYKYLFDELFDLSCSNFNNSTNDEYLARILCDIQRLHSHYNEEKLQVIEEAKQACMTIEGRLRVVNIIRQQLLERITLNASINEDKV